MERMWQISITKYWQKYSIHFDSFGTEYIPLKVLNRIKDKSINHNIFRTQGNSSIMCGLYCIAFMEYVLTEKTFSNGYKKVTK